MQMMKGNYTYIVDENKVLNQYKNDACGNVANKKNDLEK